MPRTIAAGSRPSPFRLLRRIAFAASSCSATRTSFLFGSDCPDPFGQGEQCIGTGTLDILRRLVDGQAVPEKTLGRNAHRIMRL